MKLEFYKRGQGYYTRMGTAAGAGLLSALGCMALYSKLEGITTVAEMQKLIQGCAVVVPAVIANRIFFGRVKAAGQRALFFFVSLAVLITLAWVEYSVLETKILVGWINEENVLRVKTWGRAAVPVVVFSVLGWIIFRILNMPKYADFMIDTEGEMKKVSWSTKKEIMTSTKVVIATVVLLAALLAVVDLVFARLLSMIGVLKIVS